MIYPVILVVGILIGILLSFLESRKLALLSDKDEEYYYKYKEFPGLAQIWFFAGFVIMIIWAIALARFYIETKANITFIDQKIELIEQTNKNRIESALPILEKYPELEKEIISGIKPEAFAVLGDVYPNLKSSEIYNTQAKIILDSIQLLQDIKMEKITYNKELYAYQVQLWFLY